MKKAGFRKLPLKYLKSIGILLVFSMSTIYFGGLLAHWKRSKDIHMEDGLFAPSISLVKTGIARSMSGGDGCDVIEFTFTVTNTSTNGEILVGIEVTDALLGGIVPGPNPGSDLGNDGEMDPGEVWIYTAFYNIQQIDIVNGQIVNQANVTADVQGQPGVEVSDISDDGTPMDGEETVIDLIACQPGISVIKVGAAIEDIDAGPGCNYILYTFSVANEGNQILENVELRDPLLGGNPIAGPISGDDFNVGFLDPGEVWGYSDLYDITVDDINSGQVVNQAEVTADVQNFPGITVSDLSDDDSFLEDDPTVIDLTFCQGGISLIKVGAAIEDIDAGPGCNYILYTFSVANEGVQILEDVVLDDPLLDNAMVVINFNEGDDNNNTFLDPGEIWTYSAVYNITADDITNGLVENQATVTADVQGLPNITVSDDSDYVSPVEDRPTVVDLTPCQAGIYVIKTGQALSISGGPGCDVIQYTFEVVNSSWIYSLENVILYDNDLGGVLAGPDSGDNNSNTFLDPGETWIYNAIYNITLLDITNGQATNIAIVDADVQGLPGETVSDLSDDNSPVENDPTVVDLSECQGNISLIKTPVISCDQIEYTFGIVNNSIYGQELENIVVNDPLLGGDILGPLPGNDIGDDGILSVGEIWLYTAVYDVQQIDIENGQIVNQATVTSTVRGMPDVIVSDLSDDDSPLEDDPTVVGLVHCQNPALGLVKEGLVVDVNTDGCMESILYTFSLTNTGNVNLFGVFIEDPLFGGQIPGPVNGTDANNDGVLSVGETWTYETLYAITQQDINNTFVNNQASATGFTNVNTLVEDLSDDDSLMEDNPTMTPVPDDACTDGPSLGLIKIGTLVDINGDGCIESVLYSFSVTNSGGVDLDQVFLEDPLFGGQIPGPVNGTDTNDDGILSVGETWGYEALYAITQQDIDNAVINNQATVTAEPVGFDNPVFDLSDNDSLLENEFTATIIPNDACANGGAAIGLIKVGTIIDLNSDGCMDSIFYTFTVTNSGGIDLDEVILDDPFFGGQMPGPVNGTDTNDDGVLSVGETWIYEALHAITQNDIDNGTVLNQATVTANTVGGDVPVFDLSDNDNLFEDEMTTTSIPNDACIDGDTSLGLIKQSVLLDTNFDGCMDTVRYTFTVSNSGGVAFDNIVLMDQLLGGQIVGPVTGSDENSDGILSPDETWTYEADYYLVQVDIDNGSILNQAIVVGEPVGFDFQLLDLSDNDSYTENEMTATIVPSDACTDGGTPIGFEIFNGITPNGDGSNDYFRILGIENYPDNQLKIYNRWGVLVYESENYGQSNNLFFGISGGRATFQKDKQLPSGTYFYILTFTGTNPGKDSYSGYLYINRD